MRDLLAIAAREGSPVVVPAVVLAQTLRGSGTDTPINQLIRAVTISFVGLRLARAAGALIARSGLSDAVDALVAAEALRGGPALLVTSDAGDMRRLLEGYPSVRILVI